MHDDVANEGLGIAIDLKFFKLQALHCGIVCEFQREPSGLIFAGRTGQHVALNP